MFFMPKDPPQSWAIISIASGSIPKAIARSGRIRFGVWVPTSSLYLPDALSKLARIARGSNAAAVTEK